MNQIYLKARAKINLTLDILGKREDGYHEIQTLMQTLNLYDSLFIRKIDKPNVKLVTNISWLPTDSNNLIYKAAEYMREAYDLKQGLFIQLRKNIPVSAGLAGGSSDCAATLIGIKHLFDLHISYDKLLEIGKIFGADVPYCIMRGTALAEGIGEKLTRLPNFPFAYIVLVKPPISVSTAYVFKNFTQENVTQRPDIDLLMQGIHNNDIRTISQNLCNVLESVTETKYPIITEIKNTLMEEHALGALMSGSGPTVYGIFTKKSSALAAYKVIKSKFNINDVFLTTVFNVL